MTLYLTLSWAPDGSCIIAVNGENGTMPTAPIISRDGWNSDMCLYGHQAPTETAAFNPKIFSSVDANGKKETSLVSAISGQDGGISVWKTPNPKSIFAVSNFFAQSVVDLSWYNFTFKASSLG